MSDQKLTPDEELYLEIGRVAQLHVRLDSRVRGIFVDLASPSLARFLANESSSTVTVAHGCKTMLKHADVPDRVREAGMQALNSVKVASEQRNRVVHDMWLPDLESVDDLSDPKRWSVARITRGGYGHALDGTRDLDSVTNAYRSVLDSLNRVGALSSALWQTLPLMRDLYISDEASWSLDDEIAVMTGNYDATPEGGAWPRTRPRPRSEGK